MAKIEVFSTPKQTFFISIEDWQIAVCQGDKCAAALLDFFTKRHKHYLEMCENNSPRNMKDGQNPDPYQRQSLNKMNDYTLGLFGRNKIIDAVDKLVGWEFLSFKVDTQNNKSYLLLTEKIQSFIDETWIPFLKTVGEKDNPLQVYLKQLGYSKAKQKKQPASLESNEQCENPARLISNGGSLILNEQNESARLISNGGSLISNEYIVTNSNNVDLVTNSSKDAPVGGSGHKRESKGKKQAKWNGSFGIAKTMFDDYRKKWTKQRTGIDGEPIYWNEKEIGQLSNLLTALKAKSTEAGKYYDTDKDFIENVLSVFLDYAIRLDKYYMQEFTPTRFYSNFNTIYTDIKILFNNGNSTKINSRSKISDEFKRTLADILD